MLGLGIGTLIGVSVQPVNALLTKKQTGNDGFACASGRRKDKSPEFKTVKTVAAIAAMCAALATIGKPRSLLHKLEFKGGLPTTEQLKFIYGATIASRFLAARDKDELRESAVRDSLGFTSWLILGNFVQKGVTKLLDKTGTLIRGDKSKTLMSRDEVLHTTLKKLGKDTVGKKFTEMAQELKTLAKNSDEAKKALSKMRIMNIAQLSGYAFSFIMLGNILPRINIAITKKSQEKQARQPAGALKTMLKPENLLFLSRNM